MSSSSRAATGQADLAEHPLGPLEAAPVGGVEQGQAGVLQGRGAQIVDQQPHFPQRLARRGDAEIRKEVGSTGEAEFSPRTRGRREALAGVVDVHTQRLPRHARDHQRVVRRALHPAVAHAELAAVEGAGVEREVLEDERAREELGPRRHVGHLLDLDWLWSKTISEMRLDLQTIYRKQKPFIICLTDVRTGKAVYKNHVLWRKLFERSEFFRHGDF